LRRTTRGRSGSVRSVRDPRRRREHELAVEHHLQEEHEFLRARPHEHVVRRRGQIVAPAVIARDRLAERGEPHDRKVVLARRVMAKALDDLVGDRERRLPEA
jgi:hypothetical protein